MLEEHDVACFCIHRCNTADVSRRLDDQGVALRGGHHWAPPVVRALGVDGAASAGLSPCTLDGDIRAPFAGRDRLVNDPRLKAGATG